MTAGPFDHTDEGTSTNEFSSFWWDAHAHMIVGYSEDSC